MSIKAMTWAFSLPLEPRAKITLLAIADHAGDTGVAWPKISTLETFTTQSRATVQRRLKTLEQLKLLTRRARYNPDGSRTSDELRLNLAIQPEDIAAHSDEESDQDTAENAAEGVSASDGGVVSASDGGVAPETRGPSHSCDPEEPSFEPKPTPKPLPSPSARERQGDVATPSPPLSLDGLDDFKSAYDSPTTKPDKVEQLWNAMREDERKLATRAAHGYHAHCRREKRVMMDMAKFLADSKIWSEFAREPMRRREVAEGSEAFAAWQIAMRIRGIREIPQFMLRWDATAKCRMLNVPTEFPPIGRNIPAFDRTVWKFIPSNDQRHAAWAAFLFREFEDGQGFRFSEREPNGLQDIVGNWLPLDWPPSRSKTAT